MSTTPTLDLTRELIARRSLTPHDAGRLEVVLRVETKTWQVYDLPGLRLNPQLAPRSVAKFLG